VPFASIVQVQGDFNNWRHGSPLYSEENGYWSVDQGGTVIGQHYNHLITNAATVAVLTLVNPYSHPFKTRGGQPDCAERYTAPRCLLHNSLLRGGGNLLGSNFRFTEIKPAFICRFFHLSRLDEDRVDETVEAGGKWQI
jgi:hypothetical protein